MIFLIVYKEFGLLTLLLPPKNPICRAGVSQRGNKKHNVKSPVKSNKPNNQRASFVAEKQEEK